MALSNILIRSYFLLSVSIFLVAEKATKKDFHCYQG
jgi:hypothetical protein